MRSRKSGLLKIQLVVFWSTLIGCASGIQHSRVSADSEPVHRPGWEFSLSRKSVQNGNILLIAVRADPVKEKSIEGLQILFEKQRVPLFPIGKEGGAWMGIVAVPYLHPPGKGKVEVVTGTEHMMLATLPFEILKGQYPSEKLLVAPSMVSPSKKALKRILKEQKIIGKIYRQATPKKYWDGPFGLPLSSEFTSVFGTQRLYNGKMTNFHQGLDFRAAEGTPIHTPANGKVALARSLYFTGNTIILDHGYGIFTVYAHLSKIQVKEGEEVAAAQTLGLSGKTGRVNGPHLHWGAVIQKVKVDPMELVKELR